MGADIVVGEGQSIGNALNFGGPYVGLMATRKEFIRQMPGRLCGETVDAVAGEADVGLAIRDALATFPADEIVVAVRPEEEEGFVESSATDTAPQHRVEGVPVRFVVIGD